MWEAIDHRCLQSFHERPAYSREVTLTFIHRYNVVDKSDESKKKLSAIENLIGDYSCRLCKETFTDAYGLAEHKCPSIIYIEYKCPECLKGML